MRLTTGVFTALCLALAGGCDDGSDGGRGGQSSAGGKGDCFGYDCEDETGEPLSEAYCTIEVEGVGSVDAETEYIANVIFCENGQASFEALKAMAIAARSVAYWEMGFNGSICDSTDCQVFSCNGEPEAKHFRAVEATSGLYLYYEDQVTYGFYVRGDADPDGPECTVPGGENFVTYNEDKEGTAVEQTDLGWVSEPHEGAYGQNRGCMSQLGMQCLENTQRMRYRDILRFYYGDDIGIAQAQGECIKGLGPNDPGTGSSEDTGDDTTGGDATTGGESDSDTRGSASATDSKGSASDSDSQGDASASASASASATDSDSRGSDSGGDGGSGTEGDTDGGTEGDTDGGSGDSDSRGDDNGNNGDGGGDDNGDDGDPYDPYGDDSRGDGVPPGGGHSPTWEDTEGETDGEDADGEGGGCRVGGSGAPAAPALAGLFVLGAWRRRRRA